MAWGELAILLVVVLVVTFGLLCWMTYKVHAARKDVDKDSDAHKDLNAALAIGIVTLAMVPVAIILFIVAYRRIEKFGERVTSGAQNYGQRFGAAYDAYKEFGNVPEQQAYVTDFVQLAAKPQSVYTGEYVSYGPQFASQHTQAPIMSSMSSGSSLGSLI